MKKSVGAARLDRIYILLFFNSPVVSSFTSLSFWTITLLRATCIKLLHTLDFCKRSNLKFSPDTRGREIFFSLSHYFSKCWEKALSVDVLLAQNLKFNYRGSSDKTEDISSLPMRSVSPIKIWHYTLLSKRKPFKKRTAAIWKLCANACLGQYNCAKAHQFLMQSSQSQYVSRDEDIINFEN